MSIEQKDNKTENKERRTYFRVDDVMSVIINPLNKEKCQELSKAFSMPDASSLYPNKTAEEQMEYLNSLRLHDMIMEIKLKLDFLIYHLIIDKEGLLSAPKKSVNISASGLKFTLEHPVKINDILEIKLLLPTCPPVALFAHGEVKRVKTLEDNKYEVAVEYIDLTDDVREELIRYTLAHQRETLNIQKNTVK